MEINKKKSLYIVGVLAALNIALLLIAFTLPQFSPNVIDQAESPYQSIYITESDGVRSMRSGSLLDKTSAMDLDDPDRHVYEYTAMMMLALGYVNEPQRFLVVGLGGGTVTRALRALHPGAEIVNVEFDPEIVNMARKHFYFETDERMRVVVQDARRWLRGVEDRFDVIFLDAYHGGYIPFHLTTREFLELVRERLAPGGAVCANTWMGQKLTDRESATYHAVFGDFDQFLGEYSSNRIIVAAPGELPEPEAVLERLAELDAGTGNGRLDLTALHEKHFTPESDWPEDAKILTDDHAPVNLLKDRG
jgi:spermidine synthase